MVSSIEISSNDVQNNAQLDQISSTNEQFPTQVLVVDIVVNDLFSFIIRFFFLQKDLPLDQTSQFAQKPVDQIEDDCQEMVPSIRVQQIYIFKSNQVLSSILTKDHLRKMLNK